MKSACLIVAGAALACAAFAVQAQHVKGNEAVRLRPDGTKQVETPPLPTTGPILKAQPCGAANGCNAGAWLMVETNQGLMECTEPYARPNTCRASSYGSTKLLRAWIVKANGAWLACQEPNLASKCVNVFARPPANLPFPAVQ